MIFVTGGTGFLGRHLIAALCRAGHPIRVLTRDAEANSWLRRYPNVEVVQGDLRDGQVLMEGVAGCRYVIHAAGLFRFWGSDRSFEETNVTGTENLLKAALAAKVDRFLHISTAAVIGQPDPEKIIDEQHQLFPADAYQRSKLRGELIVLQYYHAFALPVIILRPGAYYGPIGEYAFNRLFFKDPMRGIIMQVDGGRYIIFPAYISDVVQGVMKALDRGRLGEVYNLCGGWITHKEAFDIVCEEANLRWPRLAIPGWLGIAMARLLETLSLVTRREPFWPINLRSYVYNYWRVSSEKAQRELGFIPTDFRQGARRTIQWYTDGQPEDIPELEC